MMSKNPRVRVCFDCNLYMPIHSDNYEAQLDEDWFKSLHHKHRTQIVDLDELRPRGTFDKPYICVSRNARDKAMNDLTKVFNNK